jgi:NADP-dependent 3-hydroxy acid dehydrogenase YdfG
MNDSGKAYRSNLKDAPAPRAVVTGGGNGIGKSIAHKLAEAGFVVGVGDLMHSEDIPFSTFIIDFTQPDQIDKFYEEIIDALSVPQVLVLNAGRGVHQKLAEGDPDTWEYIFQLNVFSALRLIRLFVPEMLKKKSGDIIFISSVAARQPYAYGGIYAASKAALDVVAETLRLEVQPTLRVTTIHPGVVDSDFFKNMVSGSHTPEDIGWGALTPVQVADAVMYAVMQPAGVALNDIVIRPAAQPM